MVLKNPVFKKYILQNLLKWEKILHNRNVYPCWDRIDYTEMYTQHHFSSGAKLPSNYYCQRLLQTRLKATHFYPTSSNERASMGLRSPKSKVITTGPLQGLRKTHFLYFSFQGVDPPPLVHHIFDFCFHNHLIFSIRAPD